MKTFFKTGITSLFMMMFSMQSYSQNWLTSDGGIANDEALDIATDATGNSYVTGYYTFQAEFGSTILNGSGSSDIFIAKYNSSGVVQWVVKAGGNGPDRGYSIQTDAAGFIYVTGYYNGTATFGATTITAAGNSQDVFIAKYDNSGNLIWVKSAGGNEGETGYGITPDNSGNVIVTGQFKGTATFGSTTLTSMIDPNTNASSFDIFTAKYDAAGNFLWVEQGTAKYDDRGLDVAVDDADNIFVVGQFSDTIQFDIVHNNGIMNAGYLMKYDPAGNEVWFVKMSAAQAIVYSVVVDANDEIFITGDFKGNLGIFTSPMVFSNSAYDYKVFIAKFTNSGTVLWVDNDGSDSEVTSKSIALDNNGDAYITGLFKCRFDEYSAQYGTGIFYSSGYRDVYITKYSSAGARQWFRHFGSSKDDYCSGIAVNVGDNPVIAGGFEKYFNVPQGSSFLNLPDNLNSMNTGGTYCGDLNYGTVKSVLSEGQKDIFITRPVDLLREPMDYYTRGTSACVRDTIVPCIANCQDTLQACQNVITAVEEFVFHQGNFGPAFDYLWNTGNTDDTIHINTSGLYTVEVTREDGCMSYNDSVYVIVYPFPASPWITDSYGINVNHPPVCIPIKRCAPDTVILTGLNTTFADTAYWSGGNFTSINDTVIQVTETGEYTFTIIAPGGCTRYNEIEIFFDDFAIHDTLDPHIVFTDSTLQATDSISICQLESIQAWVIDSAFYAVNGNTIPYKLVKWYLNNSYIGSTTTAHYKSLPITSSGWYTLTDTLFNYCGDSIIYPLTRTFYVTVNPDPLAYVDITFPLNTCPGDTVTLYANTNASSFTWNGLGIMQNYGDSITTITQNGGSYFSIAITITDSITGCSNTAFDGDSLRPRPYPVVTISPAEGIVCPNDSLLLECEPGANYVWVGPQGNNIGSTQNIYVDVPGYYHCVQTDFDGCVMTSNFVEAKEYNTPFLIVQPGNNICANGNAIISVEASSSALIQWQAPLSGNNVSQTVNGPGVYTCEITLCGITTIDSVIITQSNTPSFITGDSVICPGDTILLHANSGMSSYEWSPGGSYDPYLYVTQPGTYSLITMDASGCYGFSAPFTVTTLPQPSAPVVNDTLICAGQSVNISASAGGPVQWFTSANGSPVFTGNTFTTPVILQDTMYYVSTYDPGCSSVMVPVEISVYASSVMPTITGDTSLCTGDTLFLTAHQNGVNYSWTGPNGFTSSAQSISVSPFTQSNAGVYTLQYNDANCISQVASFNVTLTPIPTPFISPDTTIYLCAGNNVTFTVDSVYSNYLWFPGNQNTASINTNQAGTYAVSVTQNGCTGYSNSVNVFVNNPSINPTTANITVCPGNPATLTAAGSGTLTWFNDTLVQVGTGNTLTIPQVDSTLMFYVQNTDPNGCISQMIPVFILVPPLNSAPQVYVNSPVCEDDDIYLSTVPFTGATYSWTGPNGFISSQPDPVITNANSTHAGTYQVIISLTGCQSLPGTATVVVNPIPVMPVITGDTVFCENDSLYLSVNPSLGYSYIWMAPSGAYSDTNSIALSPAGINNNGTWVLYVQSNGCTNIDTFNITVKPNPVADIISNAPVCDGQTISLAAGAVLFASYAWTGPNGYSSSFLVDSIFGATAQNSGNYNLIVELNGCYGYDTALLETVDYPVIDLGADTAFCVGDEVTFTLPLNYNYEWHDNSTGNTFTTSDSGYVFVTASIGPSCSVTDSVWVDDYDCVNSIPNMMTPNGDGTNDYFALNIEGANNIKCLIFDRWGQLIFKWDEVGGSWDGTTLRGNPVAEGVYYYVVEVIDFYEKTQIHKGFIHVNR